MTWAIVKIEDIFDVARGGSPRPINKFVTNDPDGVNWIMIGDTQEGSKYIDKTAKKIRKEGVKKSREVYEGDFLLTNSMSFGRPYILKTSGCIHDGWLVLSPKNEDISTDYFYYYLGSKEMKLRLASKAAGAVVKNLNSNIVRNIEIPLPPVEDQKHIAMVLDKVDALRQKQEKAVALTDNLLRAAFLDIFGDPVTNTKGWNICNLDSLCNKITDGTHHSPQPQESGIPYITAKHLKPNNLNFYSSPTFVSQEAHETIYSRCNPEKGDVLYIKDGATTGAAAINPYDFEFSMLSSLALIKTKEEFLLPEYLCDWFNFEGVKCRILRNLSGVAITRLTIRKIKDLMIELPPLEKQIEYQSIRAQILANRKKCVTSLQDTNNLFLSLSQSAFNGELSAQKEAA